jgi:hypothetical protein
MTITEKILAAHAGLSEVEPGQLINCALDLVLANDVTAPIAIREFRKTGASRVWDPERVALVPELSSQRPDQLGVRGGDQKLPRVARPDLGGGKEVRERVDRVHAAGKVRAPAPGDEQLDEAGEARPGPIVRRPDGPEVEEKAHGRLRCYQRASARPGPSDRHRGRTLSSRSGRRP